MVKASASRTVGRGLIPAFLAGNFQGSSHTSDLKIGAPVATLPGALRRRVSAGTGRPGVSILGLGETAASWISNFRVSVAAGALSGQIRPRDTVARCRDVKQPTNNKLTMTGSTPGTCCTKTYKRTFFSTEETWLLHCTVFLNSSSNSSSSSSSNNSNKKQNWEQKHNITKTKTKQKPTATTNNNKTKQRNKEAKTLFLRFFRQYHNPDSQSVTPRQSECDTPTVRVWHPDSQSVTPR